MRIAVVGKGGSGKSVVAGTMARLLARRGHRVLALDSDLLPGLELSLGVETPDEPPLNQAAERPEGGRWRLKPGVGAVRAVQRYGITAPDGVRLLQIGKLTAEGLPPIMASIQAFYIVVHRLREARALRGWTVVGDLPAGPRQAAFDWAPYADLFVVVTEPTWKGALTARRVARIVRARDIPVLAVANKVTGAGDTRRTADMLGENGIEAIPADEAVVEAERLGVALLDHAPDSPAARAIERLTDRVSSSG